jgi:acylphosphatase
VEYCARQIGGLSGWVRNVGYDTVEALIEGEKDKVERLIEAIKQGPRGSRVDEAKVDWETPMGDYLEFGVKRSL